MANGEHKTVQDAVNEIIESCGGDVWGVHPDFPRDDWKLAVQNDETNLGYWEYVYHSLED